jgi:small subunit ribosomal protein S17
MNNFSTRGRTFTGIVVGDKMSKTVTVEWTRRSYIPKYERYERRRTRVKAHNPAEIDAREGDVVVIKETRPLSKTKHFIVISKQGQSPAAEKPAQEEQPRAAKKAPAAKKPAKRAAKKAPAKKASAAAQEE